MIKAFWICLICVIVLWSKEAHAGELAQRLANFPQWEKSTSVQPATGDLIYPNWIAGEWLVKSTLVDLVAPLAPDIVTPGFEGNRQYLNQPISFKVRFVPETSISGLKLIPRTINKSIVIVADRAFNGLNLARAYLGDNTVLSVKVDPKSPNRQITLLRGERQLVSIITARDTETTPDNRYITTEVFGQLFKSSTNKSGANPYFNNVESTTAYHNLSINNPSNTNPAIEADQVTAVYLSPQDPDYFKARSHPVALYRYRLEFFSSKV